MYASLQTSPPGNSINKPESKSVPNNQASVAKTTSPAAPPVEKPKASNIDDLLGLGKIRSFYNNYFINFVLYLFVLVQKFRNMFFL